MVYNCVKICYNDLIITHEFPILVISFWFYILIEGTEPIQSRVQFLCNVVVVVVCGRSCFYPKQHVLWCIKNKINKQDNSNDPKEMRRHIATLNRNTKSNKYLPL